MSGFAAIFRFDGAPADPAALAHMVEAIAYRGPDGGAQWMGGGAAMAHLMLHTTAESFEAAQPLANEDVSLVLAMDGWLANYDELRANLLTRGAVLRTKADAELVLRAYETWGENCPAHIEGEYAFVIWDARRREALCVKDHAGMRPLHYHWDGKRLLVASDLAGVLAAADFEPRPNRGMIAEHLANQWFSLDESLWEGVMRMLPAHTMRVGAGGPCLQRYWMPPLEVTIRHSRDEDYAAQYRELLADCVRRASRSHAPLACDVSGGHDSSGVFAMAQRLAADGRLQAPALKAYTYLCEPGSLADEIAYARAVGQFFDVRIHEVEPFIPELEWFAERGRSDRDIATYPNAAIAVSIGQTLTADGCRATLNGEGGDEFLTSYPFDYAEALAERDWRSLRESVKTDVAELGFWPTLRMFYRYGLGPNVPASLRGLRRRLRQAAGAGRGERRLLTRELEELLDQRRMAFERRYASIASPAHRARLMVLEHGFIAYAHDYLARNGARLGYEPRSPMYARRFIEFAFAIPERQRRRGGCQKYIHIKALENDLPHEVLQRRTKAIFNYPFERQLDRVRELVLPALLQCEIDWIDPNGLTELYGHYERQPSVFRPVYELWAAYGCVNLFGSPRS